VRVPARTTALAAAQAVPPALDALCARMIADGIALCQAHASASAPNCTQARARAAIRRNVLLLRATRHVVWRGQ
jgi:hypothetical protein